MFQRPTHFGSPPTRRTQRTRNGRAVGRGRSAHSEAARSGDAVRRRRSQTPRRWCRPRVPRALHERGQSVACALQRQASRCRGCRRRLAPRARDLSGRRRIENLLLGGMGAALGVLLTFWLVSATSAVLPQAFVTRSLNPLNVDRACSRDGRATRGRGDASRRVCCRPGSARAGSPAQSVLTRTSTEHRGARTLITRVSRHGGGTRLRTSRWCDAPRSVVRESVRPCTPVSIRQASCRCGSASIGHARLTARPARRRFARQSDELASLPGVTRVVRSSGAPLFIAWGTHRNDLQPLGSRRCSDSGRRIQELRHRLRLVRDVWGTHPAGTTFCGRR